MDIVEVEYALEMDALNHLYVHEHLYALSVKKS